MKFTITDLRKEFPNDDACFAYIFEKKFGKNSYCKRCKKGQFYRVKKRKCYACSNCGYQLRPLKGTIFENSRIKLTNWFYAIFLMSQSKNGVSAKELQRHIGVTYSTAWKMQNKIRSLMRQPETMLTGTVEADEAYVAGRGFKQSKWGKKYGTRTRLDNKTPVIGMVERGGRVAALAVKDIKASRTIPLLKISISKNAQLITDESKIYLQAKKYFNHRTINHSALQYVNGDIYTNTIEGF
jgi:transposase-like protein